MSRRRGYVSPAKKNCNTPHVIVTISNDIVHAYGPYTLNRANYIRTKILRRHHWSDSTAPLIVKTCQILDPEGEANMVCVPTGVDFRRSTQTSELTART